MYIGIYNHPKLPEIVLHNIRAIGSLICLLRLYANIVEITTPTTVPFIANSPPPITISNTFSQNQYYGATLKLAKGTNNQERKLTFKKYTLYNYGTNLYVNREVPKSTHIIKRSKSHISLDLYN